MAQHNPIEELQFVRMACDNIEKGVKYAHERGRQVRIAVYTEMLEEVDSGIHDLERIAKKLVNGLENMHENHRRESLTPVPGATFRDEKDLQAAQKAAQTMSEDSTGERQGDDD